MIRARPSVTASVAGFAAALCLAALAHAQQSPVRTATGAPRTAWGTPDLQGTWTGSTITPLERPKEYADKPILTSQEAAALDPETVKEVLITIRELVADGMTCILVTHELRFAREVAHRVCFTDGGVIVEDAVPDEFFERPKNERLKAFLSQML